MAKETIKEAQKRIFDWYKNNYHPVPDFKRFQAELTGKDKKIFTEQTYRNYFYKNFEGSKDLIKYYKEHITPESYVMDHIIVTGKNAIGVGLYGGQKNSYYPKFIFGNNNVKKGKKLINKKLGQIVLQDFEISGPLGKYHFFISNDWGCHIRKTDVYLKQFVETAKLRKTYSLED